MPIQSRKPRSPFSWKDCYEQLCRFKEKRGHMDVTRSQDKVLSQWLSRIRYGTIKLTEDKRKQLARIGFNMDHKFSRIFKQHFSQLVAFKKKFGHLVVPFDKQYKPLGQWCSEIRTRRQKALVSSAKIKKLNSIGFEWNPALAQWKRLYDKLVRYKKRHGDCLVRQADSRNKELGIWINTQRSKRKDMPSWQRKLLDSRGFDWNPIDTQWQNRYTELKQFREDFGHCYVPTHSLACPQLGRWCCVQRRNAKILSKHKKDLLFKIGFIWQGMNRSDLVKMIRRLPKDKRFACTHFMGYQF